MNYKRILSTTLLLLAVAHTAQANPTQAEINANYDKCVHTCKEPPKDGKVMNVYMCTYACQQTAEEQQGAPVQQ